MWDDVFVKIVFKNKNISRGRRGEWVKKKTLMFTNAISFHFSCCRNIESRLE